MQPYSGATTPIVLTHAIFKCHGLPRMLLVIIVNVHTGDEFEVYVGLVQHEPEPAKHSTRQADNRRRPRTPGKTKPNRTIFACGASPRPGAPSLLPSIEHVVVAHERVLSLIFCPFFPRARAVISG
jgi:hypothetical protein